MKGAVPLGQWQEILTVHATNVRVDLPQRQYDEVKLVPNKNLRRIGISRLWKTGNIYILKAYFYEAAGGNFQSQTIC
jgi:hypothetical protein